MAACAVDTPLPAGQHASLPGGQQRRRAVGEGRRRDPGIPWNFLSRWHRTTTATTTVMLNAGNNSIKFYNNTAWAPDLDRIMISGLTAPPPAPPATTTNCAFNVTQNVYAYASWWGTVSFKNEGSSFVTGYKVEFDVPAGASCTADALPSGATLSPLTGSGTSARTVSNHCIFTWPSATLAAGATKTFNYSTNSQSFTAASNVKAGAVSCQ
jgi:hypothetical protein